MLALSLLLFSFIVNPISYKTINIDLAISQEKTLVESNSYASFQEIRQLELKMLRLLNQERRSKGLRPLSYNEILAVIARNHSKEMAEYDIVSHYSPVYGYGLKERLQPTFPAFEIMAENVAMGKNLDEIHQNLLQSPLHYGNIINPEFEIVGIGLVKKTPFLYYATQIFSPSLLKHQIPLKPTYYFEQTPPSRPKVLTKRWQQQYRFNISEEEKLVSQGLDLYQNGNYHKAIEKYKEALQINPQYFYALFNLGLSYLNVHRLDEAMGFFNRALVQKPEDAPTKFYIAWIHFSKEEYENAEKKLLPLLKENYENNYDLKMNTHFMLGRVYDQMGKRKEAISHYDIYIQQAKVSPDKDIHNLALAIKRLALLKERESRHPKNNP
jgi:tetratricopeptide (TPR) repeat protein